MVDATPQLKRKAEEVPAQKKSKKQRQPEEKPRHAHGTPVAQSTPTSQSTPVLRNGSESTPKTAQRNGVSKAAPTESSSASRKNKKKSPEHQSTDADNVEVQTTSETASSKPSKTQKKRDKKSGTVVNEEIKDGGKQVEENEVQTTSARTDSQPQQPDKSAQRKEKKESKVANKIESHEVGNVAIATSKKLEASSPAKGKKPKTKALPKWIMSPAQGGWFLPTDPVFSPDEKFVILANLKSVQVYAAETSTVANVLSIGSTGVLTAYALSSTNPNQVYVADSNGLITLWDWVDGSKIGRWDIGATVRTMTVITQPESNEDLVYCHETGKNHIINVHALRTKSQASKTELKRVLKASSPIRGVQVLLQGKYVIVACADSIMIAKRLKLSKTAVQDFEYVWRELKFSKPITTFNAYLREPEHTGKGKKPAQDQRDVLDIAVGDEAGVILLFEDILATFAAIESNQKGNRSKSDDAESLRPKRLHWHRDAVGAVKWSLDGKR